VKKLQSKNQGFIFQIAKVVQSRRQNDRFFPVCASPTKNSMNWAAYPIVLTGKAVQENRFPDSKPPKFQFIFQDKILAKY
jgi:hypothetical protein